MRDYEELVNSLKNCVYIPCVGTQKEKCLAGREDDCRRELMAIAANAIQELNKLRWISVTERLPEENDRYLVVLKRYGFVDDIELNDEEIKILRYHDGWRLPYHIPEWINETLKQEVTHWMPLPEPPEVKK